jgi:20S proteasome subunit alpha 4
VRPFGISTFIIGFEGKEPKLYQTEPSGAYSLWKANAIGRNSKNLREFLEKNHKEGMSTEETIRLAVETLMEVVDNAKNLELCVAYPNGKFDLLEEEAIDKVIKSIEKEKEDEIAAKAAHKGEK